ncbi:hypothetical protein PENVUL_c030G00461 [Penicillium vulpinum]|uniref:Uncharacterized protein n=1 Tax=Penicillium vulpinum TaxID=29845 RepID=A0A1V6RT08_9EURO|nr:hypothetical protein PENVUL_c030G00461 [Penicillium vulpinum]
MSSARLPRPNRPVRTTRQLNQIAFWASRANTFVSLNGDAPP